MSKRVISRSAGRNGGRLSKLFGEIANRTSQAAGHALTFIVAAAIVLVWGISGPFFDYSDTWQLVINTGTTIVTFLMVFLIQNSQNRDGAAIQVKLDELIRVSTAQNSFVGIENLTDEEIQMRKASGSGKGRRSRGRGSRQEGQPGGRARHRLRPGGERSARIDAL